MRDNLIHVYTFRNILLIVEGIKKILFFNILNQCNFKKNYFRFKK